ncbi:MAG: SpoIID/LytB domain-containing protein [Clostridia bacterium]|nr:SpoIID/LytB domain-containing protein [Clostridia bacterium]
MNKRICFFAAALAVCFVLSGCMRDREPVSWRLAETAADAPVIPERLAIGEDGLPQLKVYDTSGKEIEEMDIEQYLMGVVAGEMKNDWPMEALKAQAILARTFVLKFCEDKSSKYDGADISTDVAEAQAYAAGSVNDRVEQAVRETRGLAMAYDGDFAYAWFHAHSGGMTERPSVALEFKGGDPDYLVPTASGESDEAPERAKQWTATFTLEQVARACADAGTKIPGEITSVKLGEKGESGRAKTLLVNGEAVSAPSFRLQIGANRLRSTLIDSIEVEDGKVTFSGRGFGHGVGLSQWGAYAMAEAGSSAKEIVARYFPGVQIVELW